MIRVELNNKAKNLINVREYGKDKIILPTLIDGFGKSRIYKKKSYQDGEMIYKELLPVPMFLDTETSNNHNKDFPRAWIYQWCVDYDGIAIAGRKPREFIDLLKIFKARYNLCDTRQLVIYVHNLSYDITYLQDYLQEFGECKILALKPHKYLTFEVDGFMFKCSYLLSNRSLSAWCDFMQTDIHKVDGGIDYQAIRYQDTELTYNDWFYMVNDVYALKECYIKMNTMHDDDIASVPLTNTGYVRRDARKEFRKDNKNRKQFMQSRLSPELFLLFRSEFGGGLTHGNRFLVNKIVRGKIEHYDFKSHYPSQQQMSYAPATQFEHYFDSEQHENNLSLSELGKLCREYCCLIEITFENLYIKDGITLPCISEHKCFEGRRSEIQFYVDKDFKLRGSDNGRVMYMRGYTTLVLTELDIKWVMKQYTFDGYRVENLYTAERGYFPEYMRNVISEYFNIKENAEGIQRDKAKNNLNSVYGMSATNPIRADVSYNFDTQEWKESLDMSLENIESKLDKFYKSRNSFMAYQLGCYTTSHARDKLLTMVEKVGYENFIYGDTDSLFFIGTKENLQAIAEYNRKAVDYCKSHELYTTNRKGGISYYGTFEDEKDNIKEFKFLHAKCYAFVDIEDKLHVTIAGISKKGRNGNTIENELGSLLALDDSMTFYDCGGTTSEYIYRDKPALEVIDGHLTEHASGCIIWNCEKHLSQLPYFNTNLIESEDLFYETENGID